MKYVKTKLEVPSLESITPSKVRIHIDNEDVERIWVAKHDDNAIF